MKFFTNLAILAIILCTTTMVFAQTDAPKTGDKPVGTVATTAPELPGVAATTKVLKMTSGSSWVYRTTSTTVLGKNYENYAYVGRTYIQYAYFNIKDSNDTFSTDIAYADTSTGKTGKVVVEVDGEAYKTLTIKQGEAPQHLEIPFTGKSTLRITPNDEKILFLNPRLLPGAPVVVAVKPVVDPLVEKLVAFVIQMRATALAQNNKVYADSLEKNLLDMGVKLMTSVDGTTTWERVEIPAIVPVTTPPVVPTTPPTVPPTAPAPETK